MTVAAPHVAQDDKLRKAASGIAGLDEITGGGLPRGRTTLVCGGPGCGKTLLGAQFLVRGVLDHGEPGALVTFEETAEDLARNMHSLGWELDELTSRGLLAIDHVRVSEESIVETGAWDLDGLFIRLGAAVDSVGAKRVVLDTIESLFGPLGSEVLLRAELRKLFRWLNDRGLTAIVTGERGDRTLTRHGLEEYVSDCVIVLDQRVHQQVATRRLRVVKYRGSVHGPDEYPFLIDHAGLTVLPASSMALRYEAPDERVSVGVAEIDAMFEGGGVYRASTVLLSGTPGAGKTTVGARFLEAGCERGERGALFSFEESPAQIVRNMRSVGIDLQRWIDEGLLEIVATRPTAYGLETHLARIHQAIDRERPSLVVIDPLSALGGEDYEVNAAVARLTDLLKRHGITALLTTLVDRPQETQTGLGISSLIDTWLMLSNLEAGGERNRGITVLKSRGMGHSNQVREFLLTDEGIDVCDVYLPGGEVLMGSARVEREARDRAERLARDVDLEARRRRLTYRRSALDAQIAALEAQREAETLDLSMGIDADYDALEQRGRERSRVGAMRRNPGLRENGDGEP